MCTFTRVMRYTVPLMVSSYSTDQEFMDDNMQRNVVMHQQSPEISRPLARNMDVSNVFFKTQLLNKRESFSLEIKHSEQNLLLVGHFSNGYLNQDQAQAFDANFQYLTVQNATYTIKLVLQKYGCWMQPQSLQHEGEQWKPESVGRTHSCLQCAGKSIGHTADIMQEFNLA